MAPLYETARQVVLLGLTVPREDQMEGGLQEEKKSQERRPDSRSRGWRVQCMLIEVGYASQSLVCRAFELLGIAGLHRKRAMRNITDGTEKESRWLWIKWTTHVTWTHAATS